MKIYKNTDKKSVNLRYKFNTYLLSGMLHRLMLLATVAVYCFQLQPTLTVPPIFALLTLCKQYK